MSFEWCIWWVFLVTILWSLRWPESGQSHWPVVQIAEARMVDICCSCSCNMYCLHKCAIYNLLIKLLPPGSLCIWIMQRTVLVPDSPCTCGLRVVAKNVGRGWSLYIFPSCIVLGVCTRKTLVPRWAQHLVYVSSPGMAQRQDHGSSRDNSGNRVATAIVTMAYIGQPPVVKHPPSTGDVPSLATYHIVWLRP